ncbi:uncharacterized protein C4orf19 homolog isoform X1 [Ammospiza caudacuta]|uniref:uncharacterized protein C4orf19 homolog isoform X1 n=2 Tax=Ammospiza caudacuta TaxID=2857398 RepID=UPI0027388B99|nr:uncharacterized protein C4orf19 homolog isoform X1 [Ammospiza caudacuta]
MLHSLCLSLALPFSLFRLRKIQMGCRCCKMIQSYIFDPEEVQSSGCIHEVNSYKHNEQGSNKSKFKENSENEEPKNELQQDEINKTENKNPVNSTTETLRNHRGNDSQEDGLVKRAAKLDVAVNGGNSCAQHSMLNPNTSPVKESSEKGTSSQSEASPASNRDFHTESNRSGQELDPERGSQSKAASNSIPESQSAGDSIFREGNSTLETVNNTIKLPDIDYPQNGNQTGNCVEKDSFSVNCIHSDQNTGTSAIQDQDLHAIPPWPVKESSIEPFRTDSASLSESLAAGIIAVAATKVPQAPTHTNNREANGGIEEEDAEVAAALAALEAATAGEDVEDDDEY